MSEITSSKNELSERERFYELYQNCPIPLDERLYNQFLFISRQHLMRFMFLNELYRKIIDMHGCIIEFGTRWGQSLAIYTNLRGIYEPYNYNRKVIGFDTFTGFPSIDERDGEHEIGEMALSDNYEEYLDKILHYHETESPLSHIKRYELVKGDATETVPEYFKKHPETIVALAYLDFDLYSGTKIALETIAEHLTKGSIIAFDELCLSDFPGETDAAQNVLGLRYYRLQHSRYSPNGSYIVIE